MAEGSHLLLSGPTASSWREAAKYVLRSFCSVEQPTEAQVSMAESELVKQNKTHLKKEGAYGEINPQTPKEADHRWFSSIRSGYEIFFDPQNFCPEEAVVPESSCPAPEPIDFYAVCPILPDVCPSVPECPPCPPQEECPDVPLVPLDREPARPHPAPQRSRRPASPSRPAQPAQPDRREEPKTQEFVLP